MLLVTVGNNIRTRRAEKELSIMRLYERCGVDPSNLSKIECAKKSATLRKLHKIARALECSVYDLFTEEDGSHQTVDRFLTKCIDFSPELRAAYPDPVLLLWLFDTKFLDTYTISGIEKVANGEEPEE